jgi:hypothetical protein
VDAAIARSCGRGHVGVAGHAVGEHLVLLENLWWFTTSFAASLLVMRLLFDQFA